MKHQIGGDWVAKWYEGTWIALSLPCLLRSPRLPMFVMTPKIFEKVHKKLGSRMYDFPSFPYLFPSLPLEVGPLKSSLNTALPQWSLGQSPSQNRIWCILALKSDIWWQQFLVIFLHICT